MSTMAAPAAPAAPGAAAAAAGDRAPSDAELVALAYLEARLLDERRYDEWNALFAADGIYWVPLVPDQPEGLDHTSHLYEDQLLRTLRIERLKSPRAYSQQPRTRSLHLLQAPTVESTDAAANRYLTRAAFQYVESQGDETNAFWGVVWHRTRVDDDGRLRIELKRVDLVNADAALPAVQLFI